MEIIIVILFFSLSVVVSLELFVQGHLKSVLSEQKNIALIRAQSAAELVEGYDPSGKEQLSAVLKGSSELFGLAGGSLYYDSDWNCAEEVNAAFALTVSFTEEKTGAGRMVTAEIRVTKLADKTADPLASLETGYYLAQP